MIFKNRENQLKSQEKCNDCGAYIDKINPVKNVYCSFFTPSTDQYHCNKCKKPYSKVVYAWSKIKFYSEIEVDDKGVPVGFKSIK